MTAFISSLRSYGCDPTWLLQIGRIGYALHFESLLSTFSDELHMLEDYYHVMSCLQLVTFEVLWITHFFFFFRPKVLITWVKVSFLRFAMTCFACKQEQNHSLRLLLTHQLHPIQGAQQAFDVTWSTLETSWISRYNLRVKVTHHRLCCELPSAQATLTFMKVAVPATISAHLPEQRIIHVCPYLFTQGVNEMQSIANSMGMDQLQELINQAS